MTDTPQWNDDSIDERLRDLAKGHNAPNGPVPREAMWSAIAPTLQARRVVDIAPRRRLRPAPFAWAAALAAALVLGVLLERNVLSRHLPAGAVAAVDHGLPPVVASSATTAPADPDSATRPAGSPTGAPTVRVASASRSGETRGTRAAVEPDAPSPSRSSGDATPPDSRLLYRLAARQTLVQAEALLTAYRAGDDRGTDQESMRQAGRWARDVLTSTRLLLDSPAAKDPQFRALFTDLELVLAQIVQLSGAPLQAGERDLIERAMRDRDLLPRLRSALPAGTAAS